VIERGRAADHGPSRNIAVGSTLRRHDHAVADLAVPSHANLPGQDNVLADLG